MDDKLTPNYIHFLQNGELGENCLHMLNIIENGPGNETFVDIGVESGKSSKLLLHKSLENNNKVYGIDTIAGISIDGISNHPNYTFLKKDSVLAGAEWLNDRPSLVFVDSVHIKPQVMRELYYWWDLLVPNGWLVFHDTEWGMNDPVNGYRHKWDHPCAGKRPGNTGLGCDFYAGRTWETPEYALFDFFKIDNLNVENEVIKSIHYKTSLGMTYIQKKKEYNYKELIPTQIWKQIESDRQSVLKCFM